MILNWSAGPYLNTATYAGAIDWNEWGSAGILRPVEIVELLFVVCGSIGIAFAIRKERQDIMKIRRTIDFTMER